MAILAQKFTLMATTRDPKSWRLAKPYSDLAEGFHIPSLYRFISSDWMPTLLTFTLLTWVFTLLVVPSYALLAHPLPLVCDCRLTSL